MNQYYAYLLNEMGITTWQSNRSLEARLDDEPNVGPKVELEVETMPEPTAKPKIETKPEPITTAIVESSNAPLDLSQWEIAIIAEPTVLNSEFVIAVLKSMQLEPNQAKVLTMADFNAYQGVMPTWLWSTQGQVAPSPDCRVIYSPSIAKTSQDQGAKRALWNQIKSHLSAQ